MRKINATCFCCIRLDLDFLDLNFSSLDFWDLNWTLTEQLSLQIRAQNENNGGWWEASVMDASSVRQIMVDSMHILLLTCIRNLFGPWCPGKSSDSP